MSAGTPSSTTTSSGLRSRGGAADQSLSRWPTTSYETRIASITESMNPDLPASRARTHLPEVRDRERLDLLRGIGDEYVWVLARNLQEFCGSASLPGGECFNAQLVRCFFQLTEQPVDAGCRPALGGSARGERASYLAARISTVTVRGDTALGIRIAPDILPSLTNISVTAAMRSVGFAISAFDKI